MPLRNDETIPDDAVLLRVLLKDPNWTTNRGGRYRAASLAFFSTEQEISYFLEAPGVLAEVQGMFPDHEIARVPASVIRSVTFAIERRPAECPPNFQGDRSCHVVAGPSVEITRKDNERCARSIAKHKDVTIISP